MDLNKLSDEEKSRLATELFVSLLKNIEKNNELIEKQTKILESIDDGIDSIGEMMYCWQEVVKRASISPDVASPFFSAINRFLEEFGKVDSEE